MLMLIKLSNTPKCRLNVSFYNAYLVVFTCINCDIYVNILLDYLEFCL